MKIAYLSPNFPPESGGMGTSCHYLANLVGQSQDVTVFLAKRKNTNYQTGNYKIKLFKPWFSFGYADFAPQIVKLTKDFDVVHVYYPYFGTAEFLLLNKIFSKSKPKIILHHNMDVVGEGITKWVAKIHRYTIQPLLFKLANAIFILSEDYAQNSDVAKIYKKNPDKFYVVPHGVDIHKFKPNPKFKIQDSSFQIFTAQGLDKQHYFKGIEVLIRAIHLLVTSYQLPVSLSIAGDGNLKPYYEKLVNKFGVQDNVKFLGKISQENLPQYYSQADIVAVPSTAKTECFSIVAIEAMVCGKPVIVSDWPGIRVTIKNNETGLICQPNNIKDLSKKIKYLYDNPEITKFMGERARKRVEEKYNWEVITKKVIQNYQKISKS